jgi:hypothetical protein
VHFEEVVVGASRRDAPDDARTTHFTTQQAAAPNRKVSPGSLEDRVTKELARGEATAGEVVREMRIGPVCPEHPSSYSGKPNSAKRRDAPDDALAEICSLWPDLTITARRQMLKIARTRRKH